MTVYIVEYIFVNYELRPVKVFKNERDADLFISSQNDPQNYSIMEWEVEESL